MFYEFDNLFKEWTQDTGVDHYYNENDYVIQMEVPGFTREEISVEIDKSKLNILAETKRKLRRKQIRKSWKLPHTWKTQDVSAQLKNGILTVTIKDIKQQDVETRRVQIE